MSLALWGVKKQILITHIQHAVKGIRTNQALKIDEELGMKIPL
jgi:hypothetical protein